MGMVVGTCEDCGEVELTGTPPGMSIFFLGTDYERLGAGDDNVIFFYCECGKRAYLKEENDEGHSGDQIQPRPSS